MKSPPGTSGTCTSTGKHPVIRLRLLQYEHHTAPPLAARAGAARRCELLSLGAAGREGQRGTAGEHGRHLWLTRQAWCSAGALPVQYGAVCARPHRLAQAARGALQRASATRRDARPRSRSAAAAELGAASFAHADCRNRCRIKGFFFLRILHPRPPRARRHRLPGSRNDRRGSGGRWGGLPSGRSRAGVLDARIVVVIGVKGVVDYPLVCQTKRLFQVFRPEKSLGSHVGRAPCLLLPPQFVVKDN